MLDLEWIKQNVRGVVQAGMGKRSKEIRTWNDAEIKYQIYVEPFPSHYKNCRKMIRNAPKGTYIRAFEAALTNFNGRTTLYINSQIDSHSLLRMDEARPDAVKQMDVIGEIDVTAITLDSLFEDNNISPENFNFLMLDTQCNEHLIIEGAQNSLRYFDYVMVEVTTQPVYLGSLIYDDFVSMMAQNGYSVDRYDPLPPYIDGVELGRNVLFVRTAL